MGKTFCKSFLQVYYVENLKRGRESATDEANDLTEFNHAIVASVKRTLFSVTMVLSRHCSLADETSENITKAFKPQLPFMTLGDWRLFPAH